MWVFKASTIPVIMGAIVTIKKDTENYSNKIHGNANIHELQTPFYSPPSQADPFHQVETHFASQSPWFRLGC